MYVAIPNDQQIKQGIELARDMHAESIYGYLPFVMGKVIETVGQALESPRHILLVAADDDHQVFGFFMGYWTEYFFNRERIAEDLALYVSPEVRGKIAAKLLINAYREWAYSMGCREAKVAATTGYNAAPFFERQGFKQIGTVHKARLED